MAKRTDKTRNTSKRTRGRPKLTEGDKSMAPEEVAELLAVARARWDEEEAATRRTSRKAERDYMLLVVALNAGLRASELSALRVGDLCLKARPPRLRVDGGKHRKANGTRSTADVDEVALRSDVAQLLRAWTAGRDPKDPVFPSERTDPATGRKAPMTRTAIHRRVKALMEEAGLNPRYSTHTLRHTFVRLEVEAQEQQGEVNPYFVMRRTRHRSIQAVLPYVHHSPSKLDAHLKSRASAL